MPKAELHLHLDGSLRIETALDLARTRGVEAPRDVKGMRRELVAPMPCRDQAELLDSLADQFGVEVTRFRAACSPHPALS